MRLAEAGVHTLIEKPLASNPENGRLLAKAFGERGLVGCVGHIERYNPAISALRARLAQGELGSVFQITTRRQGPFPQRIRDVGVVMDLATHDIDLTQLGDGLPLPHGSRVHRASGGRPHEDLVAISGVLIDGTITSHLVNWLSSMKERVVTVTGERGCMTASTLATELWFHRNGSVTGRAARGTRHSMARPKGDLIRYAMAKREALTAELENFRDAVCGQARGHRHAARREWTRSRWRSRSWPRPGTCTGRQPGRPIGRAGTAPPARCRARPQAPGGGVNGEVTVVGLGKIGLPLAVQIAGKGLRVHGADINADVVSLVSGALRHFPVSLASPSELRHAVAAGRLTRPPIPPARSPGATP